MRFAAVKDGVEKALGQAIFLCTDVEASLAATAMTGPAAVLISGTGAVAMSRNADGDVRQLGGLGPIDGDPGSGLILDFRARKLTGSLALTDALEQISSNGPANAAAAVAELAEEGDAGCLGLLDEIAEELLALAVGVVARAYVGEEPPFVLGLDGGLLLGSAYLRNQVIAALKLEFPGIVVARPAVAAEVGSLLLARGLSRV